MFVLLVSFVSADFWFNDSYLNRTTVNVTQLDGGMPYLFQFILGSTAQYIWLRHNDSLTNVSIYSNLTEADGCIAVGDDNILLDMDVELGNCTPRNYVDVYDANYVLVSHQGEGTGTNTRDSTGGTNGTTSEDLWTTGAINGAYDFDGVDPTNISYGAGLLSNVNSFDVEVWFNRARDSGTYEMIYDTANYQGGIQAQIGTSDGITCQTHIDGGVAAAAGTSSISPGSDYYLVCRYNGSIISILLNDSWEANTSETGNTDVNSLTFHAGVEETGGGRRFFNGTVDEIRVSVIARSDAYHIAVFENKKRTTGFGSEGATTGQPAPPPPSVPSVNLISPADNNWTNDNTPNFVFNVTDSDNATLICNLEINGTGYGFNNSVLNNTLTTIIANHSITPDDVHYEWSINCTDETNSSEDSRSINIDTSNPTTTIVTPNNNSVTTDNTPDFVFNYFDSLSPSASCQVFLTGSGRGINSSTLNNTATTLTSNTTESDGIYYWNVTCTDLAGNSNTPGANTLTIDATAPTVTLSTPINNTVTTDVTPSFVFTATDTLSTLICYLDINGSIQGLNSSVLNNTATTITSNISLSSGLYLWNINCSDIANNTATGIARNITIDTINLELPNPASGVTLSILPADFNVTGNFTFANTNCSIIFNDTITQTRTSVGSGDGVFINFSVGGLPSGNNTWFISCSDNFTTENTSLRWVNLSLSDTINLSTPNPATGLLINSLPIIFNVTGNFTVTSNCTFYFDGSINQTVTGVSNGTNIFVNFSLTNTSEANHTWLIGCNDPTTIENTTLAWFIFDFQPPVITTDFINNTLVYRRNLTGQWNFTDNLLLHRFNITIDGVTIFNESHIHANNYSYNLTFNASNMSLGNHTLFVEISDGHTLEVLKSADAYNPSNGLFNDYMKYNIKKPYKPITIIIESKQKSIGDDWQTTKEIDRYKETFKPNKPGETQTFIVTSTQKMYIANVPGSYGDKWIITGDHWRDFVLDKEPEAKVDIKLLDDYTAEVTITGIKNNPSELTFESIGDINIVNVTYTFFVANLTTTYTNPVTSNHSTVYNLTVDFNNLTFNTTNMTPNAILEWNFTNTTATLVSFTNLTATFTTTFTPGVINGDTNYTFRYHFNLTNLTNGLLTTSNQTQLVLNYTGNRINFTLIKLPENTLMVNLTVNLTLTGSTITYNFNDITTGEFLAIRLNDDTYHVRAVSEGFIDSIVFVSIDNQSIVNQTIFMSNSTSIKQFSVIDGALEAVSNATLSFYQNINGTFLLTAQGTTDFSGITQVGLDESVTYNFNVSHSDFALFTGTVTPVLDEYTIKLDELGIVFYEAIEEQVGISTEFFYTPNSSYAIANYTVINLVTPGVITWYSMNTTYNGLLFGGNISSGTITFNITPINLTAQDTINITYNIKITGHDVYTWTEFYHLLDVEGNITSVTGGLFSVTGLGVAGRVILAMFLVIVLMVAVGAATKSLTVAAIVGMFVLGGTMAGGLIPFQSFNGFNPGLAAVTSLIVLGFLIVTDQLVGRVST